MFKRCVGLLTGYFILYFILGYIIFDAYNKRKRADVAFGVHTCHVLQSRIIDLTVASLSSRLTLWRIMRMTIDLGQSPVAT